MKTLNLLLVTLILSSLATLNAESTIPVSLNATDWSVDGFTLGIIATTENDVLVINLPTDAEGDPWQAKGIPLTSIDLNTYPVLRIKLTGTGGVSWNIKASPLNDPGAQIEIIGSDQWGFGTFDYNIVEKTGFSGTLDFNLFIWIIGKGTSLNIEELYFFNPITTFGPGAKIHPIALTYRNGGITLDHVHGKDVRVFSVDGKLIRQAFTTQSSLDIDLEKGIYLIKAGAMTLKVAI
jgi:hypothetical protein